MLVIKEVRSPLIKGWPINYEIPLMIVSFWIWISVAPNSHGLMDGQVWKIFERELIGHGVTWNGKIFSKGLLFDICCGFRPIIILFLSKILKLPCDRSSWGFVF